MLQANPRIQGILDSTLARVMSRRLPPPQAIAAMQMQPATEAMPRRTMNALVGETGGGLQSQLSAPPTQFLPPPVAVPGEQSLEELGSPSNSPELSEENARRQRQINPIGGVAPGGVTVPPTQNAAPPVQITAQQTAPQDWREAQRDKLEKKYYEESNRKIVDDDSWYENLGRGMMPGAASGAAATNGSMWGMLGGLIGGGTAGMIAGDSDDKAAHAQTLGKMRGQIGEMNTSIEARDKGRKLRAEAGEAEFKPVADLIKLRNEADKTQAAQLNDKQTLLLRQISEMKNYSPGADKTFDAQLAAAGLYQPAFDARSEKRDPPRVLVNGVWKYVDGSGSTPVLRDILDSTTGQPAIQRDEIITNVDGFDVNQGKGLDAVSRQKEAGLRANNNFAEDDQRYRGVIAKADADIASARTQLAQVESELGPLAAQDQSKLFPDQVARLGVLTDQKKKLVGEITNNETYKATYPKPRAPLAPPAPVVTAYSQPTAKTVTKAQLEQFAAATNRTPEQAAEYARTNQWSILD